MTDIDHLKAGLAHRGSENAEQLRGCIGHIETGVNRVSGNKHTITCGKSFSLSLDPLLNLPVKHIDDFSLLEVFVETQSFSRLKNTFHHGKRFCGCRINQRRD